MHIEDWQFGPHSRPLLIAELSANHDRNLEQALQLVDIAADTGWDCLKLQTYTADSLTLRSSHPSMMIDAVWGSSTLYELYETASMPMEFHEPLFARARERGLIPFTSVYDPRDIEFAESLNCSIYKVASFELTFDTLLVGLARTGKPIILSTGMATLDEIEHALDILDSNGAGKVILLHCCSSYPAPRDEINLRAMSTMGEHFSRMVGFSDHTLGSRAALTAAAMGAVAIEKHFTNDATRAGPDHRFSATPDVLMEISEGVHEIHQLRGSDTKHVTDAEQVSRQKGRRSAFTLSSLREGHVLTSDDFRFVRPSAGIPANRSSCVLGKALARDLAAGQPITPDDLAA